MHTDVERLRADLLSFYDRHRRDLPWRGEDDPYRILVSEIMLQQTRVETVKAYYRDWLSRFPDVHALAGAGEDDVLKAWEGLGYYRRARNLHAAARVVREEWGGALPSTVEDLRALPGVGEYTAGAVASIAFGHAVPAVDGNVRRVLSRLHDEPTPSPAWLRARAADLVDPRRPGDWNQAMMELGATVCTPRSPSCHACPVATACDARAEGTVLERPAPKSRRRAREAVIAVVVLVSPSGAVLLQRRGPDGLLAGMWAFPEREVARVEEAEAAVRRLAGELLGGPAAPDGGGDPGDDGASESRSLSEHRCEPRAVRPLSPVPHRFTHLSALYVPWVVELGEEPAAGAPERIPEGAAAGSADSRWVHPGEAADLALPVAQRSILETISLDAL